jgi:hypothetical protein
VQRDGEQAWLPAAEMSELRLDAGGPEPAGSDAANREPFRAGPPPRPQATVEGGGAAAPSDKVAALKAAASRAWAKTRTAAEHGVGAVQKATGLPRTTTIALLAGAAALVLLMLCTLPTWYEVASGTTAFGTDYVGGESYTGLSYFEGKLAVILAIVALVWCGLGLLRRQWLATGLLVAGGVGTCSAVMLIGLRSRLAEAVAGFRQEFESLLNNAMLKDVYKAMDARYVAYVGFALSLAILFSLCAAAAFVAAGAREPQPLKLFPDKGPFVERYGWLIGSQVAGLLLGVIIVVWRH